MRPLQDDQRDVIPPTGTTTRTIELTVNGAAYRTGVPARRTLLDLLRDQLALTGTKKVCDMGHCGACTVLRDGKAVLSCLTLAASCDGADIRTVEGLASADGILSGLQQAFIDCDAFQCGFCTPGQLMSAAALLAENPTPSREEIRAYMAGNLCRCGAYSGIVDAIEQAARRG
ncbi:MAG TPA: (2Fe-2S)-binding protein [Chloroflexia bacterium]|jgi:xanthine dehydrogenase YagT iron-sulfur-binding subunit